VVNNHDLSLESLTMGSTDDDPVVSVLVTVHNRAHYVGETLASILKSSYRSFEIVVVDDCSTDDSLAVVRRAAECDTRIRVFANEKNLGDYGNRLRAASLARGRFLKYVDSDDLIYPHTLNVMVDSMLTHPTAALGLSHREPEAESPYPIFLSPREAWTKHFVGRGVLACGPTGAIFSREAFLQVGGFRPEWGVLSDIDLWLRLSARWPVVLLPPGLVWWRKHEGQEFRAGGAEWSYLTDGFRLAMESLQDAACPLTQEESSLAMNKARQHHARRLLALALRKRRPGLAWAAFRESRLSLFELFRGFLPYQR